MRTDLVAKFPDVRILVIGDWMTDVWVDGTAERLSPEAPVPVFQKNTERMSPGGAGNMAACAEALGCRVKALPLPRSHRFPLVWPVRTRYMVNGHQLLRVDDDSVLRHPVTPELEREQVERIERAAREADIIAVSDYGQGAITRRVVVAAIETGKRVVVDPARNADISLYKGAHVIKPNRAELHKMWGVDKPFLHDLDYACQFANGSGSAIVVTLGERGMIVVDDPSDPVPSHIPAHPVPVADVTGAGDTAMAALCAMLGAGATLVEAAEVANLAASLSVQRPGTATVSADELMKAFEDLGEAP